MLTRAEIEETYEVSAEGVIESFGKFESEPVWAPYFYALWDEGEEVNSITQMDEYGNMVTRIWLEAADYEQFPELKDVVAVDLHESEQGFVSVTSVTQEELEHEEDLLDY